MHTWLLRTFSSDNLRPDWFLLYTCVLVQILEEQHALFFHLQQQRLIELIRSGKTEEALAFAQEYLAPHGEGNEAFLEELGEYACSSWYQ